MKVVSAAVFIGIGMVLATLLFYGVNVMRMQGPNGMMGQSGHMGMGGNLAALHTQMGGDMATMHTQLHNGEAMPPECAAMMDDPALLTQMTQMMNGGTPMTPEEVRAWMNEASIPADQQEQCLAHMTEHHPAPDPAP